MTGELSLRTKSLTKNQKSISLIYRHRPLTISLYKLIRHVQ